MKEVCKVEGCKGHFDIPGLEGGVCSEAFLKCLYTNVHQTERVMLQSLGYKMIAGVKTFWDSTHQWG